MNKFSRFEVISLFHIISYVDYKILMLNVENHLPRSSLMTKLWKKRLFNGYFLDYTEPIWFISHVYYIFIQFLSQDTATIIEIGLFTIFLLLSASIQSV